MNRDSIFSALDLEDVSSGAYAGGWLETGGTDLEVENPATGERDRRRQTRADRVRLRESGRLSAADTFRIVADAACARTRQVRPGHRRPAARVPRAARRAGRPRDGQDQGRG